MDTLINLNLNWNVKHLLVERMQFDIEKRADIQTVFT